MSSPDPPPDTQLEWMARVDAATREQQQELHSAIALVITSWARVEDALCRVLIELLGEADTGHAVIAPAIFFAPRGIEGRIEVVSAALRADVRHRFPPALRDRALTAWRWHADKTRQLSKMRNRVAHGSISLVDVGDGRPRALLARGMYHEDTVADPGAGSTAADVRRSGEAAQARCLPLSRFAALIAAVRRGAVSEADAILGEIESMAGCD